MAFDHETRIPEERARIFQHLGIVVSLATTIDARMIQVGAYLDDPEQPNASRAKWVSMNRAAEKRSALRKILPTHWLQGGQLIEGIQKCFAHRNTMGHGSLKLDVGGPPSYAVSWRWLGLDKNGEPKFTPIALDEMDTWEYRFRAVEESLHFISGPGRLFAVDPGIQLASIDLANSLRDNDSDDWSLVGSENSHEWNAAIDWLYPPKSQSRRV